MDLENIEHAQIRVVSQGLLAFCKRLGWPSQSCRIMSKPKSHIGAAGIAAAASSTSFRRRLQADAPMRPRAGARGRPGVRAPPRGRARAAGARCNSGICGHGLGAFMAAMNVTLDAFADVIDETQLSMELYFYAPRAQPRGPYAARARAAGDRPAAAGRGRRVRDAGRGALISRRSPPIRTRAGTRVLRS